MAVGMKKFDEIISSRENKGNSNKVFPRELWPALRKDGDSVKVRFLENSDDFVGCMAHTYTIPNIKIGLRAPCLDEEDNDREACPACGIGEKKSFKGFVNVIYYDAPIYKRADDGKFVKDLNGSYVEIGREDDIAVWVQGIRVFRNLHQLDVDLNGITNRDFRISRVGRGESTQYVITPAGDPEEISNKNILERKHNLLDLIRPLSYERMVEIFQPTSEEIKETEVKRPFSPLGNGNRFSPS